MEGRREGGGMEGEKEGGECSIGSTVQYGHSSFKTNLLWQHRLHRSCPPL